MRSPKPRSSTREGASSCAQHHAPPQASPCVPPASRCRPPSARRAQLNHPAIRSATPLRRRKLPRRLNGLIKKGVEDGPNHPPHHFVGGTGGEGRRSALINSLPPARVANGR